MTGPVCCLTTPLVSHRATPSPNIVIFVNTEWENSSVNSEQFDELGDIKMSTEEVNEGDLQ